MEGVSRQGGLNGADPLGGLVVVLYETQDLVNIALVVRAMKNMGLSRLRLVRPFEFEPFRIEGIAHDTADLVSKVEVFHDLDEALADLSYVVGSTARRRSSRQQWYSPEDAAWAILPRSHQGPVALLFGREDRGLSNEQLDRCHALVSIPTNPDHPSMNLAHSALLVFYEMRKVAMEITDLSGPDLSSKKRQSTAPASVEELEDFFATWERAMHALGFFHGIDPLPKMRSFRSLFQRADMDRRELGLVQATAFEIIYFAERETARARERAAEAEAD
jgi:tRNA/rRNA methyltransferase/tRNA (cytidine32/uridine32-2'-O)-methyltransferase